MNKIEREAMKITPVAASFGALVEDVQLGAINERQFEALYQAFLHYKVLFFSDQLLTAEQHLAIGQCFGELEPIHPFFPHLADAPQVVVIETREGLPPGESYWHTDLTWKARPSKCALLHAQHCPASGGDTIWTDMEAVWQSLDDSLKQQLRPLLATHALHAFENSRYDHKDEDGESYVVKKSREFPAVHHPVVAQHPETGRETLYINEQFTRCIDGLEEAQSQALLETLFATAREEKFQVRFQWQANSLAIWDNRATQHFAVTDYGDQPRRLHRVTITGDAPQATQLK
ncbi:TauD/TfdA family dioxygenase [Vibrio vulnificus]|nr:TauD/TfdA family dioxygenase [Vibrio vulnificus]ELI0347170.1 TauD/TfdA family dioxygenase [Vibrio vulnificus]